MRVALVTHFYPAHGGGVEQVAAQLARRMVAAGCKVVWCASDCDEPPVLQGVVARPMRSFNGVERASGLPYPIWGAASTAELARVIRGSQAVHVHDCIYMGSLLAAWLARRHGKVLVVTQHIGPKPLPWLPGLMLGLAYRLGARQVLAKADGVAFISPAGRRHFEQITGPLPHYHYVANGVDPAVFHATSPGPAALRVELGFDPARPLMLFVGRFVATKRLPLLREMALARPDWQWCVIGHGPEQPQAWGLANVRVLPPMPQHTLRNCYQAADLLVLPSEGEGFPLVVQEAMACGLPACISADVAAGSAMPRALWLELPAVAAEVARQGVRTIDAWLAGSAAQRQSQREACARHATEAWQWDAAAQSHLKWMRRRST